MDLAENCIWVSKQFNRLVLSDRRLEKRAELLAYQMIANPSASIPTQNGKWKDIKAAYRFYDSDKVKFGELVRPHVDRTKKMVAKKNRF